jgi:hypothetical protein
MAPLGQRSKQAPQPMHLEGLKESSFVKISDSGLLHQRQDMVHPFRKRMVLIPGPSWIE